MFDHYGVFLTDGLIINTETRSGTERLIPAEVN